MPIEASAPRRPNRSTPIGCIPFAGLHMRFKNQKLAPPGSPQSQARRTRMMRSGLLVYCCLATRRSRMNACTEPHPRDNCRGNCPHICPSRVQKGLLQKTKCLKCEEQTWSEWQDLRLSLRTIEIFVFFERRFRFCVLALCTRIKALVAHTHRNHSTYCTSALPPKADMCSATRYVRFVPIADIRNSLMNSALLNETTAP